MTLHVSSIVPITLIGHEVKAFLAHYARENEAMVLIAGPIAVVRAPEEDRTMKVGYLPDERA